MIRAVHPLSKLAVCAIWITASIVIFDTRFQLATICIVIVALTAIERRPPLHVLALMVPFALFGLGFFTTSVLFRQESDFALSMARESPFAGEAASAGVVLFLRAIACGMVSALFVITTDPAEFVKSLMVNCRLSPGIGYALFSAMQIVPDIVREAQQVRIARAMRSGRPPRRLPGALETASLVVPVLAYAIRRAGRAAVSMEARGLDRGINRTVIGAPPATWRDGAFILCSLLLLALSAWAAAPS